MRRSFIVINIFLGLITVHSQEERKMVFKGEELTYYVISDAEKLHTDQKSWLPNLKVRIFVLDESPSPQNISQNELENRQINQLSMDQYLHYYLKMPNMNESRAISKFLQTFVLENFNRDFFDRNHVNLFIRGENNYFDCESLTKINEFISRIIVSEDDDLLNCVSALVSTTDQMIKSSETSKKYEPVSLKYSQRRRKEYQNLKSLDQWKNRLYISITRGFLELLSSYEEAFDEETLVDFSNVNGFWSLDTGYMIGTT